MAENRESRRPRKPVDYKLLHSGPQLPASSRPKNKTWSTSRFYELEVLESKYIEENLYLKVHYTEEEWTSPIYDDWRLASDVIDIPRAYVSFTEELKELFLEQLGVTIKESLHGQRKVDSVVNISIPIQRDLYVALFGEETSGPSTSRRLESVDSWKTLLGQNWHRRIINEKGDFAYITPGTISFWMKERKPLQEFSAEGVSIFKHRGFLFHLKFVRGLGNKYDFRQMFHDF